jgi:hypothetical protein
MAADATVCTHESLQVATVRISGAAVSHTGRMANDPRHWRRSSPLIRCGDTSASEAGLRWDRPNTNLKVDFTHEQVKGVL